MAENRWKTWAALMVLLLVLWGATACGRKKNDPDEAAEAVTLRDMTQVKKLSFRETFGQYFEVEVIATEDKIQYRCSKQDILGKTEQEVITRSFSCGHDTWWDLVSIYNHNYVFSWLAQEDYQNRHYSQDSDLLAEYPDVEFFEEGDFFNIADSGSDNLPAPAS